VEFKKIIYDSELKLNKGSPVNNEWNLDKKERKRPETILIFKVV
jgi:hypothetical protein